MFHWMICFCWPCLMMYFGHAWCIYIYFLIVALFFKCFQLLLFTFKKKEREKNEKKRMKLNKWGLGLKTWIGLRTWLILFWVYFLILVLGFTTFSYFSLIPHCSSIPLGFSYLSHTFLYLVHDPITTLKDLLILICMCLSSLFVNFRILPSLCGVCFHGCFESKQ